MAAYCILDIREISDPTGLEAYRGRVRATVEQYGGRYLFVGGRFEVVEGDWRPIFPVLIEFPSMAQARAWYASPAYREILPLRTRHIEGDALLVEGVEPDHDSARMAAHLRALETGRQASPGR